MEPAAIAEDERVAAIEETAAEKPAPAQLLPGAVIGVLIGFRDDGRVPLVMFPGQPGHAALAAPATLDLHGSHIGSQVVLVFERADPRRPMIVGCLPRSAGWPLADAPGEVEIDADGERLVVSARRQLVLRCGKASITLTEAGKVLIRGDYVVTQATGVHRIKGGSVQIN